MNIQDGLAFKAKSARSEKPCSKLNHLDHSYIWVQRYIGWLLLFLLWALPIGQQKDNNKSLQVYFCRFCCWKIPTTTTKFAGSCSFSVVLAKNRLLIQILDKYWTISGQILNIGTNIAVVIVVVNNSSQKFFQESTSVEGSLLPHLC